MQHKISATKAVRELERRKRWLIEVLDDMKAGGRTQVPAFRATKYEIDVLNYVIPIVSEKARQNALLQAAADARIALREAEGLNYANKGIAMACTLPQYSFNNNP